MCEQGGGFELIDGELVEKQSSFRHGRAQLRLGRGLSPYDRRGSGGERPGGWWFLAEQVVTYAPGQSLRLDVAGWLSARLPEPALEKEAVVASRPDWVAEIISPSNAGNDLVRKKRFYCEHGVPHDWIVDPRDVSLPVLRWTTGGYAEVLVAQRGERVRPEPFGAVELRLGFLFGDDEDEPEEA